MIFGNLTSAWLSALISRRDRLLLIAWVQWTGRELLLDLTLLSGEEEDNIPRNWKAAPDLVPIVNDICKN